MIDRRTFFPSANFADSMLLVEHFSGGFKRQSVSPFQMGLQLEHLRSLGMAFFPKLSLTVDFGFVLEIVTVQVFSQSLLIGLTPASYVLELPFAVLSVP